MTTAFWGILAQFVSISSSYLAMTYILLGVAMQTCFKTFLGLQMAMWVMFRMFLVLGTKFKVKGQDKDITDGIKGSSAMQ